MEEATETAVAFFSHLYNHNEYSEFAKLCIHLLIIISLDSVECEQAISNLNTLKTNCCTCISPRHLQDALRLALEKRPASEFPWKRLSALSLLAPSYTITSFLTLFRYHGYRKISFLSEITGHRFVRHIPFFCLAAWLYFLTWLHGRGESRIWKGAAGDWGPVLNKVFLEGGLGDEWNGGMTECIFLKS